MQKTKTLLKPTNALVMIPKLGRLTSTARKLFNVMLHVTQQSVTEHQKSGLSISASHMFSSPLSTLIANTNPEKSTHAATHAKTYLREMRRSEIDWEAPDQKTGIVWSNMALLSEVKLEKRNTGLWVYWSLPPSLLSALTDQKDHKYTALVIDIMAELDSYTAIALYEICSRYRQNYVGVAGACLTSKNHPDWWIDALLPTPAVIDPVTKAKRRREWRKFKSELLLKALKEINLKTDLVVELLENREGKPVCSVQFKITKKKGAKTNESQDPVVSKELTEFGARVGIPFSELTKKITEGFSEEKVSMALSQTEFRLKRNDLAPVRSALAYFRKMMGVDASDSRHEDLVNELAGASSKFVTSAEELPVVQALAPLFESSEWLRIRTDDIKQDLMNLSDSESAHYVRLVSDRLKEKGMYTALMARKLATSDWKSGVLLSMMIDAYATNAYGVNWKKEPLI